MSITSFMTEIVNAIETKYDGISIIPVEMPKTNGIILHGLTMRKEGSRLNPVLYVDEIYEQFLKEDTAIELIADRIMAQFEELPVSDIPDVDKWLSSPEFIDNIKIRLLNTDANMDMIQQKELIYYELPGTDLVCIFYAMISLEDNNYGGAAINTNIMKRCLSSFADAKELYDEVVRRTKVADVKMESICSLIEQLMPMENLEEIPAIEDFLYVLTYQNISYGAAAFLTQAGRNLILDKFEDGLVTVLPSSIHEVIILKTQADEKLEELLDMVESVNNTCVPVEEILSGHVYHYDAKTGLLQIAGQGGER